MRLILTAFLFFQFYLASSITTTDAEAELAAGGADAPALTKVTVKARVGVLLDELPVSTHEDFTTFIKGKGNPWWRKRAEMQIDLTSYRLTYRAYYHDGDKFQLVLPDHSQWSFEWPEAAFSETRQGHKLVSRRYEMTTYILSTHKDIRKSEPILKDIGGEWIEEFVLPIDPFLLFQRTGFACADEGQYPPGTVDAEKMEYIFDDTCEFEPEIALGPLGCEQCHCTEPLPPKSCVDTLRDRVGSIDVEINYKRVAYDATIAASFRTPTPSGPAANGADLTPSSTDLGQTRVVYKYFPNPSCERAPDELCIQAYGWRRLLYFDAVDKNAGAFDLDMGTKQFVKEGLDHNPPLPEIAFGLYEYSSCHQHYHFRHFGAFSFQGSGSSSLSKRGFCVASVNRWANAEWSSTWSKFSTCENQGINAGWSDVYQAGISCQHIDITSVTDTSGTLIAENNYDGLLCEGQLKTFPNGTQKYELTSFTTLSGNLVYKQKCDLINHWDDNNEVQVAVTIPPAGESYVTQTCLQNNQHFGPLRNCEFKKVNLMKSCTPGATTTLTCSFTSSTTQHQVVRICESSIALNTGTACRHENALKNLIIGNTGTTFTFQCPSARDAVEVGGRYSIYTAALRGENPQPVTCV